MRTFESRADAQLDLTVHDAQHRQEAVAEVRLGRRAHADARTRLGNEVELAPVGVRRVHDRRALTEAAFAREQRDRPNAVLGQALLDFSRLLVCVHVERQLVGGGVCTEFAQRVGRAGAHGVGRDRDVDAVAAKLFELTQVVADGALPEARTPPAEVARVDADEGDPRPRPRPLPQPSPRRARGSGTPRPR